MKAVFWKSNSLKNKISVEIFERISNIIKHLNIFTAVIKNIRGKNKKKNHEKN